VREYMGIIINCKKSDIKLLLKQDPNSMLFQTIPISKAINNRKVSLINHSFGSLPKRFKELLNLKNSKKTTLIDPNRIKGFL
jgi:hypothetical protein